MKTMMVYFKDNNIPDLHLPITKIDLSEALYDCELEYMEGYENITNNIQFCKILGYNNLNFKKNISLNQFNQLAEKLQNLDDGQKGLLYSILDCKFNYLNKNYEDISPQNICSLIDNLHNFKMHNDKNLLDFDQMMRISTHESTRVAIEYIGTENTYVNNYAEYETYEMPVHDDFIRVTLLNKKDNTERTLVFPLEDDDLEWVENMDNDLSLKIKNIISNLDLYASFKVTKEDLQELNDFAITYFDRFELTQNKFKVLYEYYDEFLMQSENGITFDKYFEILDSLKDYHIYNHNYFKVVMVDRYCELNNISDEAKNFIDRDKMFQQIFDDTPIYLTFNNMYIYHKEELDLLFEEKNLINVKNKNIEKHQEQEFNGVEM